MRQLIGTNYGSYSFNPAARTITIAGIEENLKLSNFFIIVNVTTNTHIYTGNNPALGATIINNILTLDYNTESMSSTDDLQIVVDVPSKDTELLKTLYKIQRLLEPLGHIDPTTAAQKVSIANTPAVTVGTITTLTGITNQVLVNMQLINGIDPRFLLQDQSVQAFTSTIRSRYNFT